MGVFKDILISYGFPVVFPAWCVCAQEGTVTRQAWDNIDEHDNGVGKALSHSSNPHYVLPPATPATEGHPAPTSKRMWPVVLPQGGVLMRRPPSPQRSRSSINTNITTTLTTTTAAFLRKTRGTHSAAGLTGLPKPAPTLARAVTAHRTMETAALLRKTRGTHSAAGLTGLPKPAPTLARAVTALHRKSTERPPTIATLTRAVDRRASKQAESDKRAGSRGGPSQHRCRCGLFRTLGGLGSCGGTPSRKDRPPEHMCWLGVVASLGTLEA